MGNNFSMSIKRFDTKHFVISSSLKRPFLTDEWCLVRRLLHLQEYDIIISWFQYWTWNIQRHLRAARGPIPSQIESVHPCNAFTPTRRHVQVATSQMGGISSVGDELSIGTLDTQCAPVKGGARESIKWHDGERDF